MSVLIGDVLDVLPTLAAGSVQCVVTSFEVVVKPEQISLLGEG